ncbi:MAG: hypothetical protein AB7I35_08620 [Ramlibacter sp.]
MGPLFSVSLIVVAFAAMAAVVFGLACFFVRPVAAAWLSLGLTAGFMSGAVLAIFVGILVVGTDVTFDSQSQVVGYLGGLVFGGILGATLAFRMFTRVRDGRRNAL